MIVHFDNVNLNSRSGPNSFAKRLKLELEKLGHGVVEKPNNADVSLVFIEPSGFSLAKKVVQRLDGIWFAPHEFEANNANIKLLYQRSDHIIWQSNFDKNMVTKWWGHPKAGTVVVNGVSFDAYLDDNKLKEQLDLLKARHEKIFVSSANWHPQKRLQENLKFFKCLKKKYPTACLIVMGSNPTLQREEDVYLTGNITHDHSMQIMKSSDWMLHLAWLDHCPNTVVEALSCKVPVVCSEDGGTKELVQNYGLVLKEKVPYNYQLTNYENPPQLEITEMDLPNIESLGAPPDVSITTAARKYLQVFESLK